MFQSILAPQTGLEPVTLRLTVLSERQKPNKIKALNS